MDIAVSGLLSDEICTFEKEWARLDNSNRYPNLVVREELANVDVILIWFKSMALPRWDQGTRKKPAASQLQPRWNCHADAEYTNVYMSVYSINIFLYMVEVLLAKFKGQTHDHMTTLSCKWVDKWQQVGYHIITIKWWRCAKPNKRGRVSFWDRPAWSMINPRTRYDYQSRDSN